MVGAVEEKREEEWPEQVLTAGDQTNKDGAADNEDWGKGRQKEEDGKAGRVEGRGGGGGGAEDGGEEGRVGVAGVPEGGGGGGGGGGYSVLQLIERARRDMMSRAQATIADTRIFGALDEATEGVNGVVVAALDPDHNHNHHDDEEEDEGKGGEGIQGGGDTSAGAAAAASSNTSGGGGGSDGMASAWAGDEDDVAIKEAEQVHMVMHVLSLIST